MVAHFCHLLSDLYVFLLDPYVDLSDLYIDSSLIHLLDTKSEKRVVAQLKSYR